MAEIALHCCECTKTCKTFQALLKHFDKQHVGKETPRRISFYKGNEEIEMITAQALPSSALLAEYKAWLVGVTERINGLHHQRHKSKLMMTNRYSMI